MRSVHHDHRLEVVNHAQCLKRSEEHAAPDVDCDCGLYSLRLPVPYGGGEILAQVRIYGTIVEHEAGYRAEYQRIEKLYVPHSPCIGRLLCENEPSDWSSASLRTCRRPSPSAA